MPYIKPNRRAELEEHLRHVPVPYTAGELNFVITTIIKYYFGVHGKSYMIFNDIMGALEAAKAEFYRRVVVPYEDEKIKANGDVY